MVSAVAGVPDPGRRWVAAGRASAGDIAFVLTSFFLLQGYLRDIGQHVRTVQPGLNYHLPYPIETVLLPKALRGSSEAVAAVKRLQAFLLLPEAGHFVQEQGRVIAEAAVRHFQP